MRALIGIGLAVVFFVSESVWSIPLPGSPEEVHLIRRDVDDEIVEPLITEWPDLPLRTETPQFAAISNFGDVEQEDDAMTYILLENENIIRETDGFMEGDIYIGSMLPRNAITSMNKRWPNAQVPYEITGFDSGAVARINAAINEYHTHTCIRWVRRSNQRDYVRFVPKSGCWSPVGRTGGMQELSVGGACNWSRGTIMHEMMHAAGFHHEQTRQDRDNYVTIYWQNIQRGMEYNFQKYPLDTLGTEYDYYSIMHYPKNAFSTNGRDTIVPKQSVSIGGRNSFSQLDAYELNKLYECGDGGGGGGGGEEGGDCADKDNGCSGWAGQGYCTSGQYTEWMADNCKKSCGSCDDDNGGGGGGDCTDSNNNCPGWADRGECQANPGWMLPNCKKSCDQCDGGGGGGGSNCKDKNANCEWWSNQGFCQGTYSSYMGKNCQKSCNSCGNAPASDDNCQDRDSQCAVWAWHGECTANPAYMLVNCRRSCAVC